MLSLTGLVIWAKKRKSPAATMAHQDRRHGAIVRSSNRRTTPAHRGRRGPFLPVTVSDGAGQARWVADKVKGGGENPVAQTASNAVPKTWFHTWHELDHATRQLAGGFRC